jgi:hypothetical protein
MVLRTLGISDGSEKFSICQENENKLSWNSKYDTHDTTDKEGVTSGS